MLCQGYKFQKENPHSNRTKFKDELRSLLLVEKGEEEFVAT